jgi:hypothetical protein
MLISSRKGSWTHLALITGLACLCLGIGYGVMRIPFCWHCHSGVYVEETRYSDSYAPGLHFTCARCQREWMALTPWWNGIVVIRVQ